MSNVGRWDHIYERVDAPIPYGDTTTYKIGADFLRGCATIEDWGCGGGWFRTCISADSTYIGVDGSVSRFADRVADLENYQSRTDGLFMRHVLEHNYAWRKVLVNAVASFSQRMALILFTPLADEQTELAVCPEVGVPDLSLSRADVFEHLAGCHLTITDMNTATHYGAETVLLIRKES